jgi:hypothetical protein
MKFLPSLLSRISFGKSDDVLLAGYDQIKAVTTSEHGEHRGPLTVTNLVFVGSEYLAQCSI